MIKRITVLAALALGAAIPGPDGMHRDEFIQYGPVQLSAAEKQTLRESLDKLHDRYDPREHMLTKTLTEWNYHTDAQSGVFHETRGSLSYAVGLLDLGQEAYRQRAFDLIRKTVSLQDTVSTSRTFGIWPYYLEEPLATKKSPADWNWADFNGVSLLDIYMGHEAILPEDLKATIRQSLIRAARSIRKRDVQPGYTNIALMGTYVTFVTAHLFDQPDLKVYARNRLNKFYDYTLKRGFTEYNSPTYTLIALDELDRMKRHIVDRDARPQIDSLYTIGWDIIARHYHPPSGQWAGPHSRSYGSLLLPNLKGVLGQASGGRIALPGAVARNDVKIRHRIPEPLMAYFLSPTYPRTQRDVLAPDDPQVIGTTYLTDRYALSSANRSSLWNQRRPLLAYWGTPQKPHYLQVRFLHDGYDFSSATLYSSQQENHVLAAINFLTNGGDKHISIDRLKDGKFRAKDLRLRFEFGQADPARIALPRSENAPVTFPVDGVQFSARLFHARFGDLKGRWEKGGDAQTAWLDFVLYTGPEQAFDLSALNEAALGFTLSLAAPGEHRKPDQPTVARQGDELRADWKGLTLTVGTRPGPQPRNL